MPMIRYFTIVHLHLYAHNGMVYMYNAFLTSETDKPIFKSTVLLFINSILEEVWVISLWVYSTVWRPPYHLYPSGLYLLRLVSVIAQYKV